MSYALPKLSPFHSFVDIKLLVNPWTDPDLCDDRILSSNRYYYHSYFLNKWDTIWTTDLHLSFCVKTSTLAIVGKPTFRYAQFIHKTGFYIVELRDNGDFFLAPNNMHLTRVRSSTTLVGDYENYSKGVLADSQTVMLNFRAACQNKEF